MSSYTFWVWTILVVNNTFGDFVWPTQAHSMGSEEDLVDFPLVFEGFVLFPGDQEALDRVHKDHKQPVLMPHFQNCWVLWVTS